MPIVSKLPLAEVQGALAATYTLGYRFALLASGALALILADHVAWSLIYQLMAALVLVLMIVTYLAKEPERQQQKFTSFGA
jgi:PAT family beta-lactamase induction signal transducer AmpG